MSDCLHCALPIESGTDLGGFCCRGCRAVYELLHKQELTRYYDLRPGAGVPIGDQRASDRSWVDELQGHNRISIDVQGIHCSGCVWVIEKLFERQQGAGQLDLNPTLGRAEITVGDSFQLPRFVEDVESLGYRLGPASEEKSSQSDGLLIRTGICLALAGNGMFWAFAQYFGLSEGPIYRLLNQLSYAAAVLSVLVGGSVFIRAAWQGLRQRLLHLDLPIAVGIVLAFAGTSYSYFFDGGRAEYVDTLTIFIALMLLGRWVQERVLERNRRRLLSDEGVQNLRTRRFEDGTVRLVPCTEIAEGDVLYLGAADLVPVDGILLERHAAFSSDWIDGESEPRAYKPGDQVPAGAFHSGNEAVCLRASTSFAQSPVLRLLRTSRGDAGPSLWWRRVSLFYVVAVLVVATVGALAWAALASGLVAIQVATAVLVVTCPCAFGIAAPLAYELAQMRLRRRGLFVLRRDFFDRAQQLERIAFDKTGTLTTGRLSLENHAPLESLTTSQRKVLATLASASVHPKSLAVAEALGAAELMADARPREVLGQGVELVYRGQTCRLGSPGFCGTEGDADVLFTMGKEVLVELRTVETPRADARAELAALEQRYELFIISGDHPERVQALAAQLGIDPQRAIGGASPDDKAAWLDEGSAQKTMMVGDGLNDLPAAARAGCAGTPAIDRPFLASRCDFYFTTPGLRPIREALETSDTLASTLRAILAFAVVYNVGAVALALAGLMAPWLAAVLMPTSSIVTVTYTLARLGRGQAGRPASTQLPQLRQEVLWMR